MKKILLSLLLLFVCLNFCGCNRFVDPEFENQKGVLNIRDYKIEYDEYSDKIDLNEIIIINGKLEPGYKIVECKLHSKNDNPYELGVFGVDVTLTGLKDITETKYFEVVDTKEPDILIKKDIFWLDEQNGETLNPADYILVYDNHDGELSGDNVQINGQITTKVEGYYPIEIIAQDKSGNISERTIDFAVYNSNITLDSYIFKLRYKKDSMKYTTNIETSLFNKENPDDSYLYTSSGTLGRDHIDFEMKYHSGECEMTEFNRDGIYKKQIDLNSLMDLNEILQKYDQETSEIERLRIRNAMPYIAFGNGEIDLAYMLKHPDILDNAEAIKMSQIITK